MMRTLHHKQKKEIVKKNIYKYIYTQNHKIETKKRKGKKKKKEKKEEI